MDISECARHLEPYAARPEITEIAPEKLPFAEHPKNWNRVKNAQLEYVAMLIELYPEHELYFLARDMEPGYDLALALFKHFPEIKRRIHLLNVSRATLHDPNLMEYLAQEGISEQTLASGKKVLLVDSGLAGTIWKTVQERFSDAVRGQIQGHLMLSRNNGIPSSRASLFWINKVAAIDNPFDLDGLVLAYEYIPHYTDRAASYEKIDGQWQAVSSSEVTSDGKVSKKTALKLMADIQDFARSKKTTRAFKAHRAAWKKLFEILKSGDRERVVRELKAMLAENPGDLALKSRVLDLIETNEINLLSGHQYKITAKELGLRVRTINDRETLGEEFPQWKDILRNFDKGIRSLLEKGDFETLYDIHQTILDSSFDAALADGLGGHPASSSTEAFIERLIADSDPKMMSQLALRTLSRSQYAGNKKLLGQYLKNADEVSLKSLGQNVFSRPETAAFGDLVEKYVEQGDTEALKSLVFFSFSKPHSVDWERILVKILKEDDSVVREAFVSGCFWDHPHVRNFKRAIRVTIELANAFNLWSMEKAFVKYDYFKGEDFAVFRESIAIKNPEERRAFLLKALGPADF